MTFDFRSFAKLLAEWQGGIRLKPGRTYKSVLKEAQVREIFGGIPAARAAYGVVFNLKEIGNGEFEVTIRLNR